MKFLVLSCSSLIILTSVCATALPPPVMKPLFVEGEHLVPCTVRFESAKMASGGGKMVRLEQNATADSVQLVINTDTRYGARFDRCASVEIRLTNVEKALLTNVSRCVTLAIGPAARPNCLALDAAFDGDAAQALARPGKTVSFDCRVSMPRDTPDLLWTNGVCTAYATNALQRLSFACEGGFPASAAIHNIGGNPHFCQHFVWQIPAKGKQRGRLIVDLGLQRQLVRPLTPTYGPVDFDRVDALVVPVRPSANLLANGGFEAGLKGWHIESPCGVSFEGYANPVRNGGGLYEEIVDDAKCGKKALRFRKLLPGSGPDPFTSLPVSVYPDRTYTLSFWAKRTEDGGFLSARFRSPKLGPRNSSLDVSAPDGTKRSGLWPALKADWARYEMPFASTSGVVEVVFNAQGVQLDGVMIAEGAIAPETADDPVTPRLVTRHARNDLALGEPIGATLELNGSSGVAGTVRVRVENFYRETCFDKSFDFKTPVKPLALDFDPAVLGQGVFVVRYDITAAGKSWCDFERFAITDPLANRHPTAFFFLHYPFFQTHGSAGHALADWMVARGIGSTSWPRNDDRRKAPLKTLYDSGRFRSGVHTLEHDLKYRYPKLYRYGTTTFSNYTNVTEALCAYIEREGYLSGSVCEPDDCRWALSNEEEAGMKILARDGDFDGYFKLQYACWKGLKRAFDERGLKLLYAPTHGMCHYRKVGANQLNTPVDRRWAFDRMLEAARRANFKYDFISMHMYGSLDGSVMDRSKGIGERPDRNECAETLFAHLERFGYGSIPVRFEEGFNILPYSIPAWGAADWGDRYYSVTPSQSYGHAEFIQAGAIARIYLMDLRWWPRVETAHVWQHRPVMDFKLTPWMWTKVSNTLGHLLPDPRFVTRAKPAENVLAYVYRQSPCAGLRRSVPLPGAGDYGVLAVWTHDNDVERGKKAGPVLRLDLPKDAVLVDLMGNVRARPADGAIPLTPAPLFILSSDAGALARGSAKF